MAFIKHAEHKLLTLSTVNLQRSRRGKKKRRKKKSNETEAMEKSTRCFWGVSTDPSKGLTPRAHRRAAPRARTEAGGRCHEHWLVRGCSSTYEQSVGLSQRRNTAEILREGGCMSSERHRELQTSLQEKLGDVPSRTHPSTVHSEELLESRALPQPHASCPSLTLRPPVFILQASVAASHGKEALGVYSSVFWVTREMSSRRNKGINISRKKLSMLSPHGDTATGGSSSLKPCLDFPETAVQEYLKRLRSCLPQQLPELLNFGGEVTAFCCVTEPKRGHFHEQCPQPRGAGTATSEMPPSLRLSSRTVAPWHGFPCRREIFPPGLVFSEGTVKPLRQRARPSGARSGLLEPSSAAPAAPSNIIVMIKPITSQRSLKAHTMDGLEPATKHKRPVLAGAPPLREHRRLPFPRPEPPDRLQRLHHPDPHFPDDNYGETEQCCAVSFSVFSWETAPLAASMHIYHEMKNKENLRLTDNIKGFKMLEAEARAVPRNIKIAPQ
ncbi:hypothetical protein Anapl_12927 [Anas platyrhynchos]|uniref:Uncharacterized protein n=1 Tax=Anas platyrhynchos TaxID=8839 RepID=R0JY56_ANAPL|nr:hypothetical protein Anapl_12927 [Anas platyrhynchos]